MADSISRSKGTAIVTRAAVAWLWSRRRCRVIGAEVGFDPYMRRPDDALGAFRVDLVGIHRKKAHAYRIDLVEVKGSRSDARREKYGRGRTVTSNRSVGWTPNHRELGSKWWEAHLFAMRPWNLWLAVFEDVRDEDLAELPDGWGVLSVAADGSISSRRKPAGKDGGSRLADPYQASEIVFRASQRSFSDRLPFMGGSVPDAVRALEQAEAKR